MRTFLFRSVLGVGFLAAVVWPAVAGVRGKPSSLKTGTASRVAQAESDYSAVNSVPVPPDSVNVIDERIVGEVAAELPNNNCVTATPARTQIVYMPMPMMVVPMMAPTMMSMPMANVSSCATCGGLGGGLSPVASAGYGQAFGPGLYRSGAESGMNHYPYYSYRRPWYFPGQPSFHRNTDYVW